MTATATLQLLAVPGPATPVIPAHRIIDGYTGPIACFAAPSWPLLPMNGNPGVTHSTIHWDPFPAAFREEMRLLAWTLINRELTSVFLRERGPSWRSRQSPAATCKTVGIWARLAEWLTERGTTELRDCTTEVLREYGHHLRDSGAARSSVHIMLSSLTRLWAFDQLSGQPSGVGRPPWETEGVDDYLPPATSGGENDTEAIAEQTMGPLLIWAIRMVEDFSDDILAAWAERNRLRAAAHANQTTPASLASLKSFMAPLIAGGLPIPTTNWYGKTALAGTYISAITGASTNQVYNASRRLSWRKAAQQRPGSCPLDIPVTGMLAGITWREALDYNEGAYLMRQLGTACFIVIAYLTGMRPGEAVGLRSGCCPDPDPDEQGHPGRHLITSTVYKTARDEDGNHRSEGELRDVPWVAIAPVVNAIRVLERIVPDGELLFDHHAHDLRGTRAGTGALTVQTMADRVEDFVSWANEEAKSHGLTSEGIPSDPHGAIGTERFRRSLAWHIARRPGGLVALAVQYGHLRTSVSVGYASRSRDGIHELLDVETARATIDTVADLHDDLEDGIGISGPAARRAITAAATAAQYEGTVINARQARQILANPQLAVYDNPNTLLMCVYKRDKALCHRGIKDTPSLDRCVTTCGNIARTDQHITKILDRADYLEKQAVHVPGPLGDRLRGNAARLRDLADVHHRTRITLQDGAA
ncbi:integrase [Streptomyces sp. NBC_01321]|uniref:integrase n=1 Tax=Streptomyces sp. NBC_01321 TaxID=2903825 RepID=UPI002E132C42|nr:integrase [Streptomyces sp. NBC_01321]